MKYQRGDLVRVEGFGGMQATLRVWDVREGRLLLCTDEEFHKGINGNGVPDVVGFPMRDIKGRVEAPVDIRDCRLTEEEIKIAAQASFNPDWDFPERFDRPIADAATEKALRCVLVWLREFEERHKDDLL